jgi:hypothetical protein
MSNLMFLYKKLLYVCKDLMSLVFHIKIYSIGLSHFPCRDMMFIDIDRANYIYAQNRIIDR